eukprot:gene3784-4042_t
MVRVGLQSCLIAFSIARSHATGSAWKGLGRLGTRLFSAASPHQVKTYSESYTLKTLEITDVDAIQRKVNYIDESPKTDGHNLPPLVIIGGTAQTINTFLPHIQTIRRKRRLIIFELRGQGQTELDSNHCTMIQLVADVNSILQSLQVPKIHLAGFSFGGRVALAFTATHPKVVEKVSITGVPLVRPALGKMILQSWEDSLTRGNLRECAWSFLINGYSEAFLNQYGSKILSYLDIIIAANKIDRLRNLIRFSHVMSEDDPLSIPNSCRQITCPVQIIAAKYDRIAGYEDCLKLADAVPHSRIELASMNTGHLAPFEDPVNWRNHLLKFLG